MTALIAVASVLAYLTLTLLAARRRYQAIRPYTEPLACYGRHSCGDSGVHSWRCYARPGGAATPRDAVALALLLGLAWPVTVLAWPAALILAGTVSRFVAGGARQLPAEVAAETRRLLAENERLRQQQEGG